MKLLLILIICSGLFAADLPLQTAREIEAMNTDLEKAKVDYEKKVSDRKALAVQRLKAQLKSAKGEDVLAIKGALDEISGEAEDLMGDKKPASQSLVTDEELALVKKGVALDDHSHLLKVRERLLNGLEKRSWDGFKGTLVDIDRLQVACGWYISRDAMTMERDSSLSSLLGTWCSPDPVARWKVVKESDVMPKRFNASRFMRACFTNKDKFLEDVSKFAKATKEPQFKEFE